MNDNQLGALIRGLLLAGFARHGVTSEVIANYQPTQQGRETGPVVYFFAIGDTRHGWQGKQQVWNEDTQTFDRIETQILETPYQVIALAPQDPTDLSLPTAKDLCNDAAMIINSASFVEALTVEGLGVQRVTQVRNPYFTNDQGQFEASPSFDFTLTRKKVIIDSAPAVKALECNLTRV